MSHKPYPIKVANTALSETMKADQIAIKTAKNGKVTAVVTVMSIFCKKRCNLWNANSKDEKLSHQKAESANFLEENSCESGKHFSENKKRPVTEEISV